MASVDTATTTAPEAARGNAKWSTVTLRKGEAVEFAQMAEHVRESVTTIVVDLCDDEHDVLINDTARELEEASFNVQGIGTKRDLSGTNIVARHVRGVPWERKHAAIVRRREAICG
eukprot:PhM_4_TR10688/c0_g1_i1/m.17578